MAAKKQFTQKKGKTVKSKKAPPRKIPKEKMAAYLENLEKKEQEKITPEPEAIHEALDVPAEEGEKEDATSLSEQHADEKNQDTTEGEPASEKMPAIESSSGQTADSLTPSTWDDLKEEKKQGFFWPLLFFALLGFIIGIAFFAYQEGVKKGKEDVYATPSPTQTPLATPTEIVTDKISYTIRVLNGSGRGGEAARAKSALETDGFIVASIGNAERSDYNDTIIQAKSKVSKSYLEELVKELKSKSYDVSEPETLDAEEETDVVIIIGRNREE